MDITKDGENCIMSNFIFVLFTVYYYSAKSRMRWAGCVVYME